MGLILNRRDDEILVITDPQGDPIGQIRQRVRARGSGELEVVNDIEMNPRYGVYRENICSDQLLEVLDERTENGWHETQR